MNEESSPTRTSPLYLWVASLLRDSIEAGELAPNASVPSERALSERYGISRMTARHALETLMHEGYVCRDARRGTFVAEPRLHFSVGSFTQIMAAGDHVPGCEVLTAETLTPDPLVSEMLHLPSGGRIHLVQRLRSAEASRSPSRTSTCRRSASPIFWISTSPARSGRSCGRTTVCTPPRPTPASSR